MTATFRNNINFGNLANLSVEEVGVGFFRNQKYPDGTPVPVVAGVNEFGSSDGDIPERPFMRNAVSNARNDVVDVVADGIRRSGDASVDRNTAERAGDVLVNAMRDSIDNLRNPANAPDTLKTKRGNNPLVDTGKLRDSVEKRLR